MREKGQRGRMRNPGREAGVLRCGAIAGGVDRRLRLGWWQDAGLAVAVPGDGGGAARWAWAAEKGGGESKRQ